MTSSKPRASRAKFECPTALSVWISTVNLVSPVLALLPWPEMFGPDQRRSVSEKDDSYYTFREFLSVFGDAERQFVLNAIAATLGHGPELDYHRDDPNLGSFDIDIILRTATTFYENLRLVREDLRRLAWFFEKVRGGAEIVMFYKEAVSPFMGPTNIYTSFEIVGTQIQIRPTEFANSINGVDGDRIRECEVCSRIFWARRKDAVTDSNSCLNILRQRRFRLKNRRLLNEKRRNNYQYKNKNNSGQDT